MMLDKAGVAYEVINAEADKETAVRYGISKAPTLIVPTESGIEKFDNASEIRRYIESRK